MAAGGLAAYYKISDTKVEYYYWNPMSGKYRVTEVTGADPKSFEQISVNYGKDKKSVFIGAAKIYGADNNTFHQISEFYAQDNKYAYFIGEPLVNSHSKSFERLGNNWSKDKNNIYYTKNKLDICDLASFRIIPEKFTSRAVDEKCYYWKSEQVKEIDRTSFQVLTGDYSKDKNNVYWANIIIKGADPKTFQVKADGMYTKLARDKNRCFSGPKQLKCSDLNETGQKFCGCN
jgi:hypothetical protein